MIPHLSGGQAVSLERLVSVSAAWIPVLVLLAVPFAAPYLTQFTDAESSPTECEFMEIAIITANGLNMLHALFANINRHLERVTKNQVLIAQLTGFGYSGTFLVAAALLRWAPHGFADVFLACFSVIVHLVVRIGTQPDDSSQDRWRAVLPELLLLFSAVWIIAVSKLSHFSQGHGGWVVSGLAAISVMSQLRYAWEITNSHGTASKDAGKSARDKRSEAPSCHRVQATGRESTPVA